ncbi:YtxH domain-containing protein [Candidatus Gottesmanbacteria bacterium]|nr:YtxH domain-containing protein [Candidatus Gottesmanbacteria bacterium]
MSDENHKDIKFWVGFFVGGLLGAIILFFLGTKEGKKTGRQLEEKGRDLFDDLLERLEEFEKKGKELITEGEVVKEQVMDVIEEKKEELTDTATDRFRANLLSGGGEYMVAVDRRVGISVALTDVSLRLQWPTEKGSFSVTMQMDPSRERYARGLLNNVGLYNKTLNMLKAEKDKGIKADPTELSRLEMQLAEVRGMLPEGMRP